VSIGLELCREYELHNWWRELHLCLPALPVRQGGKKRASPIEVRPASIAARPSVFTAGTTPAVFEPRFQQRRDSATR